MTDPFRNDDESVALAAEFVVGVLPAEDRKDADARIHRDPAFADLVNGWSAYFAGLNHGYGSVHPPRRVKDRIDRALFASAQFKRLWWARFGQIATGMFAALLIGFIALEFTRPPELVALLDADNGAYQFAVSVDGRDGQLDVELNTGEALPDQVFELWLVLENGETTSLGTFAQSTQLPAATDAEMQDGAVLAVSVEPIGGSPAGVPTGPVVAVGVLGDA